MNRKLRALGLALVAVLALSAVAAASASAVNHKFKGGAKTTFLTAAAEEGEAGHQVFEATTGEHKASICTKVNAKGTQEGTTESVTVEPEYSGCGVFETKEGCETTETKCTKEAASATVLSAGCHYRFQGATTLGNPTGGEHANVEIINKSGACTHIEVRVTGFQLKCISVPAQTIEHAVTYKNETTEPSKIEDVTVKATAHGIENTTTNSIACPTKTGETEVHTNGSYTGAVRVTGFSNKDHTKPTNVTIE